MASCFFCKCSLDMVQKFFKNLFKVLSQRFYFPKCLQKFYSFSLPNVRERFNFSMKNVCENARKCFYISAKTARKNLINLQHLAIPFRNVREKKNNLYCDKCLRKTVRKFCIGLKCFAKMFLDFRSKGSLP